MSRRETSKRNDVVEKVWHKGIEIMLRLETEDGWWLITHPDHAHLAGTFAEHWGNAEFRRPAPLNDVLHAIHVHDDGWINRDAQPSLTRQGKPSAFSIELVGKYSAFEEIDLEDYLAVRERAVSELEQQNSYAALLVSMHTYNLLTERADRSTVRPDQVSLLDSFLERQHDRQDRLRAAIRSDLAFAPEETTDEAIRDNFRLLQACDNLSLLSCVAYDCPATLLHPLLLRNGEYQSVDVLPQSPRSFRLSPYPFTKPELTLNLPARFVPAKIFSSLQEFRALYAAAPLSSLEVRISA
jgi:hypothetical protein